MDHASCCQIAGKHVWPRAPAIDPDHSADCVKRWASDIALFTGARRLGLTSESLNKRPELAGVAGSLSSVESQLARASMPLRRVSFQPLHSV